MSTFKERAQQEATKNPIFLFQKRIWIVAGDPDGYEGYYLDPDGGCFTNDNGDVLTFKTCFEKEIQAQWADIPVLREEWITEKVYLTREEAEQAGITTAYNYSNGWRVFCVPCYGLLPELIERSEVAA